MEREVKVFEVVVEPPEEPIPFALKFVKEDGTEETHEFAALANPGSGGSFALSGTIRYQRDKSVTDLNGIKRYFERVLVDGDFDRLEALLDSKDLSIPMDTLGDILNWLVEQYSGRPTRRSRRSAAGPRSTGRRSTAKLSSAV